MSGKKWKKGRDREIGVGRGRGAPHVGGNPPGRGFAETVTGWAARLRAGPHDYGLGRTAMG